MIDRKAIMDAIKQGGPIHALRLARQLGYKRSYVPNGAIIVNGKDWIFTPSCTMRQSAEFNRELHKLPLEPFKLFV